MSNNDRWDVVLLGETMLRWTPPALQRFEQAHAMEIHIGGSESNTAVGLARLGLRVSWLSRLTDNPLGRIIANGIQAQGVDIGHVAWTKEDRVGLYFLEEGREPRGSQVLYDRAGSAASRMQPEDLPRDSFQPGQAKIFHTTGITAAIGEGSRRTAAHAIELAKSAGWKFSFDLNYRGKLWSPQSAREHCEPWMEKADYLFLPVRDARNVLGFSLSTSPETIAKELGSKYPNAIVVLTNSIEGSIACYQKEVYHQGIFRADSIGRLGGGDAFAAGFLFWSLQTSDVDIAESLRWGAATASLKYSIPGDLPLIRRNEVEAILSSHPRSTMDR